MDTEGDVTLRGEHKMQYIHDMLYNYTPKSYVLG